MLKITLKFGSEKQNLNIPQCQVLGEHGAHNNVYIAFRIKCLVRVCH